MTDHSDPNSDQEITVTRNDEESRYEIYVGDVLGGFTDFAHHERGVLFPKTEIDPAFSGRGLGKRLASDALVDIASRGETVVPECPFLVGYLQKNTIEGIQLDWSRAPEHG